MFCSTVTIQMLAATKGEPLYMVRQSHNMVTKAVLT
jgi:hypothetical protein